MNINLDGVSETLLITLYAKAEESKRKNAIIRDPKSIEIINKINYDFSKFKNFERTQVGTCIRTKIIDDIINDIIQKSDTKTFTIINLGAGLDTRVSRFINDNIYWHDIDFEDVIALRKKFFKELDEYENYKCISSSMLDYNWIKEIKKEGTVIIISEGVLMYIEENYIKELIENLSENFVNCHFIFDTIPVLAAKNTKLHETVKETNAVFRWGLDIPSDIEKLSNHIRFINSYNYGDYYKDRWGVMRILRLFPFFSKIFNFNILHIRLV
ncbi:class I SAM-dependent methyltransferase [Brachyspira alvinipulli]|uniref:class I SAM-dependent methyltransferase n=1 Tax=Brachyspira alvinipulli TaxID=84379 RepID=UPI0004850E2D|nr:class I SAM-dependent methyltransferase [Brachyspira alvinipulli]